MLLAGAIVTSTHTTPVHSRLNLPGLGEPADQVMSPRDEKRIGRSFMRQIRAQLDLVTDPEVNDYAQRLGKRLVATQPGVMLMTSRFLLSITPKSMHLQFPVASSVSIAG